MIKILRESNEIKQIPLECIEGATLLSANEAENLLTAEERECKAAQEAISNGLYTQNGNGCYWLRSAGYGNYNVCYVYIDGSIDGDYGCFVDSPGVGIRPVLILNLQSSDIKIGDNFKFGDYIFKVILNNLALCDVIIDVCPFNKSTKDGNNYESSYIKDKVDDWFNLSMQDAKDISQGIRPDAMIADENDFGF